MTLRSLLLRLLDPLPPFRKSLNFNPDPPLLLEPCNPHDVLFSSASNSVPLVRRLLLKYNMLLSFLAPCFSSFEVFCVWSRLL